ncbi:MAG: Tim44/TimA family putative adaptor protein, partial [Fimbriimonadaceae bacterium]|nr:Tim44/TimA family putative adaptor protein [Alphaproteobacteria bacterium]
MSELFDVYTLIYLVIAVLIFMRLRNVLGRRTGHERRPFDPYSDSGQITGKPGQDNTPPADDENVVPLPRRDDRDRAAAAKPANWGEFAAAGSPQAKTFDAILNLDPYFDPRNFLDGARAAYEMIVNGFAAGDRKTLKPLLSPDVYDGFAAAIKAREKKGETVESRFVSIDKSDIESAELKKNIAHITVRFVSKLISVTRDKTGEVVEGDAAKIRSMTDVWTFARDIT